MNLANAIAFFVLGTLMLLLPSIAPGFVHANGLTGPSDRELWVLLMGWVTGVIGGGWLARESVRQTPLALAWAAIKLRPLLKPALGEKSAEGAVSGETVRVTS